MLLQLLLLRLGGRQSSATVGYPVGQRCSLTGVCSVDYWLCLHSTQ